MGCERGVLANRLICKAAFNGSHRSFLHLGKRFNIGGRNGRVLHKGLPFRVVLTEFVMLLPGPVTYINIHQARLKLNGQLTSSRQNISSFKCAFQWTANNGADWKNG